MATKGRLLGIDFGGKRCGIAETDDLQLVAGALKTVETPHLLTFVGNYISKYMVEALVIGEATRWSGEANAIEKEILIFIEDFSKKFPSVNIYRQDESGSSKQAMQQMLFMGVKKKNRAKKENVDLMSAVLILQRYLDQKSI